MKIVFASKNSKKAAEIQRMAPDEIEIVCLKDIEEAATIPQAEETGDTFIENAIIKAQYWAIKLYMPVIAEDSGIQIDALNGYPGVYSKRCIEELHPGADINVDNPGELYPELLKMMEQSGNQSTRAQWVSAVAYVDNKQIIGKIEKLRGNMCSCAGTREFGFDQYFKPDGYDKTLSELDPSEKDNIGPRKKAFYKLLSQILK